MCSDVLGEAVDINGGGIDLNFPHHENQLAQSEVGGRTHALRVPRGVHSYILHPPVMMAMAITCSFQLSCLASRPYVVTYT